MCHYDEMHGLLLSKTNEIIYGGRVRGISWSRVRAIRPQFNAASNGTTGWVHGTRVQFRWLCPTTPKTALRKPGFWAAPRLFGQKLFLAWILAVLLGNCCVSVFASNESLGGRIILEAPPRFIGFGCGSLAVGKCVPVSQLPVDEKGLGVRLIGGGFGINHANQKGAPAQNQVLLWPINGIIEFFRRHKLAECLSHKQSPP